MSAKKKEVEVEIVDPNLGHDFQQVTEIEREWLVCTKCSCHKMSRWAMEECRGTAVANSNSEQGN